MKAHIGGGSATAVQDCYRTVASLALEHRFNRVLIIGLATDDAHSHLTARDIVVAFDVIGVPIGFKIAFVPTSDVTLNGYRHAEIEANKRGLRAKVFLDEGEAIRWLTEPELH